MNQLHLFPTITQMIELTADSPKQAFYRLMIEECQGSFAIVKESGCLGKVRDSRRWEMPTMGAAVKKFERILKEKLNPKRGSPRKYKMRKPCKNRAFKTDSSLFQSDSVDGSIIHTFHCKTV